MRQTTLTSEETSLRKEIKGLLYFFIIGLVLSGITAFPLEWELSILKNITTNYLEKENHLSIWILRVSEALKETNLKYPFIAYGTDWLAFAHLVIAMAFIGPLKDPVKNIWILEFGMIACVMIIPLALIAGAIRGIPFYWRIIDCSFALFGFIPLIICYNKIRKIISLQTIK
jgi:hypothetical protein